MTKQSNVIEATLDTGAVLPLRATTAKSGNQYHAILNPNTGRYAGRYGVNVAGSVVGGTLPKAVTVLGYKVALSSGTTQSGNPKVEAVRVPVEVEGEKRLFSLRISQTKNGFNVTGVINRQGGGASASVASSL